MQELFEQFDQLGIAHQTAEHPPFFTVEDGREWQSRIPGLHCKTLFLKDKKDRLYLLVLPHDRRADLAAIEKIIGSARLSFAKPELLLAMLRVTPGSVTPFAVLYDQPPRITVYLDQRIVEVAQVCYHPMRNDRTTTITSVDLIKFLRHTGHEPNVIAV
jgi:Ala-tRNA(Pro) deacylase